MIFILIDTMLRYLKGYFYLFIFTLIFILGIQIFSYFLVNFFIKIKLQNYFEIEDIAFAGVILSMILTYLSIKVIGWYFKGLKEQK